MSGSGTWRTVNVLPNCSPSKEWQSASLIIPETLRHGSALIDIRVLRSGPEKTFLVHMRHFSME